MDDDLPRKKIEVLAQMTMQDMHALVDRLEQASATVQGAAEQVHQTVYNIHPENIQQMLVIRDNLAGVLSEIDNAANLFGTRVKAGTARVLDEAVVASIMNGVSAGIAKAGLDLEEVQKAAKAAILFPNAIAVEFKEKAAGDVAKAIIENLPEHFANIAKKASAESSAAALAQSAKFYEQIDSRIGGVLADLEQSQPKPFWQTALIHIGLVTAGVVIGIGIAKWLWH